MILNHRTVPAPKKKRNADVDVEAHLKGAGVSRSDFEAVHDRTLQYYAGQRSKARDHRGRSEIILRAITEVFRERSIPMDDLVQCAAMIHFSYLTDEQYVSPAAKSSRKTTFLVGGQNVSRKEIFQTMRQREIDVTCRRNHDIPRDENER